MKVRLPILVLFLNLLFTKLSDYIEKIKREEITENIFQIWSDHSKTYETLSPLT